MIIVTGGAGFVGSNIVAGLNARGISDVLVVDDLTNGHKIDNLRGTDFQDYLDRDDLLSQIRAGTAPRDVSVVFHQGACSATTEWDGRFLMRNNFGYSKELLSWCQAIGARFIYASSASVYGMGTAGFREEPGCEAPLNMYAFSKLQFDRYVRANWALLTHQVVGLRYFNVYGPGERHKGPMASTVLHFNDQLVGDGTIRLFSGTDGYRDGEQRRDFVHVRDCVDVNLWFLDNVDPRGIFNVGTGNARTFNDMARAVRDWHGGGTLEYIPFPEHLKGAYQSFTEADISALRNAGYDRTFRSLEEGVADYLGCLNQGRRAPVGGKTPSDNSR